MAKVNTTVRLEIVLEVESDSEANITEFIDGFDFKFTSPSTEFKILDERTESIEWG